MDLKKIWEKLKSPLALLLAITLFFNGWTNYDFSVFAADDGLNITLSSSSAVYTGGDLTPTIISVADAKAENKTYAAGSYEAAWSKGETPVTEIKDAGNYKVTVTVTETVPADEEAGTEETTVTKTGSKEFEVTQLNLADCTVAVSGAYIYTGEAIEPAKENVSVFSGDVKVASELYTVDLAEGADNVNAGEAGITVTAVEGNANVTGSNAGSFTIKPYPITEDNVNVELFPESGIYNTEEKNQKPEVTATVDNVKTLSFDNAAPALTVTEPDNTIWNSAKEISVTASDDNLAGVYYIKNTETAVSDTITQIPEGLTKLEGGTLSVAENIENENIYYFYAIDKAGHVSIAKATVKKVDAEKPEITIQSGEVASYDHGIFWKSADSLTIFFEVTDNLSGIKSIKVTKDGEDKEITTGISADRLSAEISYEVSSAGTYTITVTDEAENEKTAEFTVEQDSVQPEVVLYDPEGTDPYKDTEMNVWWFRGNTVSIPFTVTDDCGDGEEKSPYTVVWSTDDSFTVENTATVSGNQGTVEISNLTPGIHTYYFKVTDKAGNKGEDQTVTIGYDDTEPEITEAIMTQLNGDEWINNREFNGKSKVKFSVKVNDAQTGISKISYSYDGGNKWTHLTYEKDNESESVYAFDTDEMPDGRNYQWQIKVTNNVNKESKVESFVKDVDGEPVYLGQIDTTAPSETAYIRFISDTEGANVEFEKNDEEENSGWTSKIWDMVNHSWNKIWGKREVKFEVYVHDATSGINTIQMSYDRKNIDLRVEKGIEAFMTGDSQRIEGTGYKVFSGSITCGENETLEVQRFAIDSLTDVAGNVTSDIILNGADDKNIIYLDSVNPELVSVEITDENGANSETAVDDEKYYYSKNKYAVVTIKERFFGQEEKPVYPELVVSRRTTNGKTPETEFVKAAELSISTWTKTGEDLWSAKVELPSEKDTEYEYQLTIEGYKDGAGNILVGNDVNEYGNFASKIFVIDTLAPEITEYTVERTTECNVDGAEVRQNDKKADDLIVSFKMDDNAEYYEKSKENLLVSLYKDQETEPVATWKVSNLEEWGNSEKNGREHSYSFSYDGEKDTENKFHVEITYADQAGNDLICRENLGLTQSTEKNGTCVSGKYIIDHVTPKLTVTYSDATNVVNAQGKNADGNAPLKDYTAYYNKTVNVTLTFDEKFVNVDAENGNVLEHFEITMTKDGAAAELPELTWKHEGRIHTATFTLEANADHSSDGDYQFTATYRDCAENQMDAFKSMESNTEEGKYGVYTSPKLVIDTTAPEIITSYVDAKIRQSVKVSGNMVDYLNADNPVFRIVVKDRNIRYQELKDSLNQMSATDISKKAVETVLKENINAIEAEKIQRVSGQENAETWRLNLSLQTDANYRIPVYFKDLAGNEAIIQVQTPEQKYTSGKGYTEFVTKDNTVPELELSYTIEDTANYWEWGYFFAKAKMTITAHAEDAASGVQTVLFRIVDENGKETTKTEKFRQPVKDGNYSVSIPLHINDFKGSVYAEIVDYSTNVTCQTRGHIVESSSKHSATGTAEITTITKPSRTVRGVDFYNEDVKFKLFLQDTYSGIAKWEYIGGHTLKYEKDYKSEVGADLSNKQTDREKDILYTIDETLTLDAEANNENEILVTAQYTDNAGYKLDAEQEYNIDITKPIITVEYDLNNPANGKYYKETRTATVKIRERNFDPEDVEWLITSTDGQKPEISGWSQSGSGDDAMNVCTVAFTTDSDYTFSLKFMDMAGNVADYSRIDEFTIDKTEPEVTVTYDNNSYLNEYYYDASRTATIDILEHNFDPSAIEIMVTADGGTSGIPHISGWLQNGDHNITTITFHHDAEYTFDITGMDLAFNELADYTPDHFVVDQTAPELEIFDVEDMSANNGEVRPGIRYHDTNYDSNGTVILMTGYNNGVVEMNGTRKLEANGLELKLDDFAYVQEMDDLYTMEATVYDLAGNSSGEKVMFSVNRFGSVYTYDEATAALVGENGKYYTKKEQALGITETNVDTLEFKEITVNLNGKLRTLKEGQDFTVKASGTDATWKQYQYNIKADNFKEEGTYVVTIYSEDRAANTSDNNTKGKKIEFVVDKTNPSVLISGVENNGQYKTSSQEMLIDIDDNVLVSKVSVIIDGMETVFDAAQIAELDGRISISVDAANHAQNIKITAADAAGNSSETEITNVRVNANAFMLFYLNKAVFYGTLCSGAVIAALLWWLLSGKKK